MMLPDISDPEIYKRLCSIFVKLLSESKLSKGYKEDTNLVEAPNIIEVYIRYLLLKLEVQKEL